MWHIKILLPIALVVTGGALGEGHGGEGGTAVPRVFMTPAEVRAAQAGAADPVQAVAVRWQ